MNAPASARPAESTEPKPRLRIAGDAKQWTPRLPCRSACRSAESNHRQRLRSVTRVTATSRDTRTAARRGHTDHAAITAAASWSSTSRIVTVPGTATITCALSPGVEKTAGRPISTTTARTASGHEYVYRAHGVATQATASAAKRRADATRSSGLCMFVPHELCRPSVRDLTAGHAPRKLPGLRGFRCAGAMSAGLDTSILVGGRSPESEPAVLSRHLDRIFQAG